MYEVINIAWNDLRLMFKDRGNWVGIFALPIVFTLFIGFGAGGGQATTQLRVDVIDHDQSAESQQFLKDIRQANNTLVLCPIDNDDKDFCGLKDTKTLDATAAEDRLKAETSLALIEIPASFGADLKAGKPVTIGYRSNENATAPSYIAQAVQAAVQKINGASVAAQVGNQVAGDFKIPFKDDAARSQYQQSVYDSASTLWAKSLVTVDYQVGKSVDTGSKVSSTQAGFGQSVPGMGSMFVMFTVFAGMQILLQERKNWTLQRMVTTPLSRAQLLGGKILGRFLMGIAQFLIVFAVGAAVGLSYGQDVVALVLLIVLYTMSITAFSFAIAPRLRTEMQAASLSLLLSMILAPLGGAWWPLDIVPNFMKIIGHISPVAWAMDGFNSLLFNQGSLGTVLVPMAVLAVLTVVFFALGIRGFQYE